MLTSLKNINQLLLENKSKATILYRLMSEFVRTNTSLSVTGLFSQPYSVYAELAHRVIVC